jgi:hypothetical protein
MEPEVLVLDALRRADKTVFLLAALLDWHLTEVGIVPIGILADVTSRSLLGSCSKS